MNSVAISSSEIALCGNQQRCEGKTDEIMEKLDQILEKLNGN
ncbi:MAG: hypothetical protein AAF063_13485 [Cyanobacteria bacterium J06643_5]